MASKSQIECTNMYIHNTWYMYVLVHSLELGLMFFGGGFVNLEILIRFPVGKVPLLEKYQFFKQFLYLILDIGMICAL